MRKLGVDRDADRLRVVRRERQRDRAVEARHPAGKVAVHRAPRPGQVQTPGQESRSKRVRRALADRAVIGGLRAELLRELGIFGCVEQRPDGLQDHLVPDRGPRAVPAERVAHHPEATVDPPGHRVLEQEVERRLVARADGLERRHRVGGARELELSERNGHGAKLGSDRGGSQGVTGESASRPLRSAARYRESRPA